MNGDLNPDNPNVVEYGPTGDGTTTVDVSDQDEVDIEVFGAGGADDGGEGGRVIGFGYDVADVSSITLQVADGRLGYVNGGEGPFGNSNGGGVSVVQRDGTLDLAAHGGGGGGDSGSETSSGGGGGAAGGLGGDGSNSDRDGDDAASDPALADLGGDGGDGGPGDPGSGEVLTSGRFGSTQVEQGGGRSAHEGLVRIKFTPTASVQIVGTNSPIGLGDTLDVDVEVTNNAPGEQTFDVDLEVGPP